MGGGEGTEEEKKVFEEWLRERWGEKDRIREEWERGRREGVVGGKEGEGVRWKVGLRGWWEVGEAFCWGFPGWVGWWGVPWLGWLLVGAWNSVRGGTGEAVVKPCCAAKASAAAARGEL